MINFKGENVDQFFIDNYNLVPYLINRDMWGYPKQKKQELIENAMLTYQNCVYSYDADKGFKFATFLGRSLHNYVIGELFRKRSSFHEYMISLDQDIGDDNNMTILDVIKDDKTNIEQAVFIRATLDYVDMKFCNRDRDMFFMHLDGVKQNDIALEFQVTQSIVSRVISKIQSKLRKEFLNEKTAQSRKKAVNQTSKL